MTVTLTGAGGLFTRLGLLFGREADILALEGGTATDNVLAAASMVTNVAAIEAAYAAGTALYAPVDGIMGDLTNWQSAQAGFMNAMKNRAANTIIQQVDADVKLQQQTLALALTELIRQMTGVATVKASVVAAGAQTSQGSPNGDAKILLSVKDGSGLTVEYAFAETLLFKATTDSQSGGTLNQEKFSVSDGSTITDAFNYLWPRVSGVNTSLTAVDATLNNSGGNLLQNSEFLTQTTANVPDNWTITVGGAGTTVFVDATTGLYDTSSLKFTGDGGGTLSAVTQAFNTTPSTGVGTGGTSGTLKPLTNYGYNFWIKCSSTPSAGVLEISLIDGTPATIANAQAVNNLTTQSLTAISTSWVNVKGSFQTPALLPTTIKLKVRLSTAIDSGKSVYIDRLSFTPLTQLYSGGPSAAVFSGGTKVLLGDAWTIAITNTTGVFQRYFERNFGMRALGLILPSTSSPSIADSLVV